MTDKREAQGSCLCGAVRITAKAASNKVGACHCGMCRKWSGGPLLSVDCGGDVVFEGADNIGIFDSSGWAERGFCKRCGSHLFYKLKAEKLYSMPVGLFGDSRDLVFDQQIFIDAKPAYYSFSNQTANMTGAEVFAQYTPPS
jgi:hypothetical protein